MRFLSLKSPRGELSEKLFSTIFDFRKNNTFNPSFCFLESKCFFSFRGFGERKKKPFKAYYGWYDFKTNSSDLLDLSEVFPEISSIADPKIFKLNEEVWLTFNTGYTKSTNKIFILPIFPKFGKPIECTYPDRQRIEKNWAFFLKGDCIMALYSLDPLVVLNGGVFYSNSEKIIFREEFRGNGTSLKRTSLGTPLLYNHKGSFIFVGHKKISFLGKRLYLGHPGTFTLEKDGRYSVRGSNVRIFHSLLSLLGKSPRHNKNLISCTYFSGLASYNNNLIISYGINDLDFNFKEVEKELLWK